MPDNRSAKTLGLATAAALVLAATTHAATVKVTVHVQSLVKPNSVSFAPLHFGFNNGTFDAFNNGQAAGAPIVTIAEGGSGSAWIPAFAAADPGAVIGAVPGALLPGASASSISFLVDSKVNPYFTFAGMVIPSNDFFIGNDDPTQYRLFDNSGNQLINAIVLSTDDIWNAGSEKFNPLNAAFLKIGNNALRDPENGVVGHNFAELAGFDGLQTAANYTFRSGLRANTDIYRITFSSQVVPEPAVWSMLILGLFGVGLVARRRRTAAA